MQKEELFTFIDEALFGFESKQQRPEITETVGPFQPEIFDRYFKDLSQKRMELRRRFNELSSEALLSLENYINLEHSLFEKNEVLESFSDLSWQKPQWYIGGLGHPNYVADFEYWVTVPKYTPDEALMLLCGLRPGSISADFYSKMFDERKQSRELAPIIYLSKQNNLLVRHFTENQDKTNYILREELKSWIDDFSIEVHPDFYNALTSAIESFDKKTKPVKELSSVERDTLLKLIAAMSYEQYGYNPGEQRSKATSAIQSDLNSVGIEMDTSTILRWLREASKFIEEELWQLKD